MTKNLIFYTTQELADILKMNAQVITRKLQKGEIPGYKIGKDWRVSEDELQGWLERHSNQRHQRLNPVDRVMHSFVKDGRVIGLPSQRKKRRYILDYILEAFDSRRVYGEAEVNAIIGRFHDDYCTIRREFIAEKMMTRRDGRYRRHSSYIPQHQRDLIK